MVCNTSTENDNSQIEHEIQYIFIFGIYKSYFAGKDG